MSVVAGESDTTCRHCLGAHRLVEKYLKLIALQQKRISQLEKKYSLSQMEEPSILTNSTTPTNPSTLQNPPTPQQQHQTTQTSFDFPPHLPENSRANFSQLAQTQTVQTMQRIQQVQRVERAQWMGRVGRMGVLVNSLTQEIMQIKANFLHVRFCVYALVRELRGGETGNTTARNLLTTLVSMLQFSEQQKDGMMGKQIKHRKRTKNSEKENVFVTIKQI